MCFSRLQFFLFLSTHVLTATGLRTPPSVSLTYTAVYVNLGVVPPLCDWWLAATLTLAPPSAPAAGLLRHVYRQLHPVLRFELCLESDWCSIVWNGRRGCIFEFALSCSQFPSLGVCYEAGST